MKKSEKNSSNLIIGIVIALMGIGWLLSSPFTVGAPDFSKWWAFGILIPLFYAVQGAAKAKREGKSTMGYIAGAVITLAVLLAFLGVISWGMFAPLAMLAVGIGFVIDTL